MVQQMEARKEGVDERMSRAEGGKRGWWMRQVREETQQSGGQQRTVRPASGIPGAVSGGFFCFCLGPTSYAKLKKIT
jgi:hypothetical protein